MYCVPQRNATNTVRKYLTAMAMHDTVYTRKSLVDLAMNVSFQIARLRVLLYRFR
jgi:hypothetical protein